MIQIFTLNGEEIQFKRDSLNIKKENNSFTADFKTAHSSYPFLIIENDITKKLLGPSDITSVQKIKIVEVIVIEFGVTYNGELQQLSVQKNFRKCNLKYSSKLLSLNNKKLNELMDIVSIIPEETNPIPFTETSNVIFSGTNYWPSFTQNRIGKIFPEVTFNFPMMYWKNKYGIDLNSSDAWYLYKNYINNFKYDSSTNTYSFLENTASVSGSIITISNYNVPMPQMFLLSPLYYALKTIGWKIDGDFTEHELIKRLMLVSFNSNICKITLYPEPINIDLNTFTYPWTFVNNGGVFGEDIYRRVLNINLPVAGTYKISFHFELPFLPSGTIFNWQKTRLFFNPAGDDNTIIVFDKYTKYNNGINYIIEGEIEMNSDSGICIIAYEDSLSRMPISYNLSILLTSEEKEYNQMHPTIDLNRYVPNITFSNYLSALKNFFNLNIIPNDLSKTLTLNINENSVLNQPLILSKSHLLSSFDLAANTSFILKYQNDEDEGAFITRNNVEIYTNQKTDFTKTIDSKFKLIPSNNITSELSEEVKDKEGFGLIIYTPESAPFTSKETINGYNLKIIGDKGIYDTFHKKFLKIRLNASQVEITTFLTQQEVSILQKYNSIYVDNQHYNLISFESSEVENQKIQVKMILETIII